MIPKLDTHTGTSSHQARRPPPQCSQGVHVLPVHVHFEAVLLTAQHLRGQPTLARMHARSCRGEEQAERLPTQQQQQQGRGARTTRGCPPRAGGCGIQPRTTQSPPLDREARPPTCPAGRVRTYALVRCMIDDPPRGGGACWCLSTKRGGRTSTLADLAQSTHMYR
jgi:hypothetical protein